MQVYTKEISKWFRKFVRKIWVREYVQNRIVLLYEGQNVIMSDLYWLKNHKNPSWGQKLG